MEFPQKTKNRTTIWSSNSTLGHISRKSLLIQKDTSIPMFIAALFTIAKIWKQPKRSQTDEDAVCMCNGILLGHEKEWNNAIWSNMDWPRNQHTKWSKSGRERQTPYDTIYMWNLKYDTTKLNYATVSQT